MPDTLANKIEAMQQRLAARSGEARRRAYQAALQKRDETRPAAATTSETASATETPAQSAREK